jgi:hypothetical protein
MPIALAAVALLALAIGVVVALGNGDEDETSTTGTSVERSQDESGRTTRPRPTTTHPRPTTTTTAPPVAPAPSDYTIALRVDRQACFGSAGCNVTVMPQVSIVGPNALNKAVRLTYQIDGAEDIYIDTLELSRTGSYSSFPVQLSTPSQDTVLTATVTAVN